MEQWPSKSILEKRDEPHSRHGRRSMKKLRRMEKGRKGRHGRQLSFSFGLNKRKPPWAWFNNKNTKYKIQNTKVKHNGKQKKN